MLQKLEGLNWLAVVSFLVAVEVQITNGTISFTHWLPPDWIDRVKELAGDLATVGALIVGGGALGRISVPQAAKLAAIGIGVCFLMAGEARASDNLPAAPVKAAAAPQAFGTSGGYFGIYTEAGGGSVNGSVAGVNSASLVTNQAGIGLLAGYAWSLPQAGAFTAFEARFKVNNVNGSTPGFAWDGPIGFEQVVKLGIPLDKVLAVIPNLGLPTAAPFPVLPAGVALLNTKSYIMASVMEDDNSYALAGLPKFRAWKASGSIGAGMIGQLSNGTALDVWAKMVFGDREICFGAIKACAAEGKKYLAGIAVDF